MPRSLLRGSLLRFVADVAGCAQGRLRAALLPFFPIGEEQKTRGLTVSALLRIVLEAELSEVNHVWKADHAVSTAGV